ncbi:hypothetical protein Bca52824_083121 [Brassica carinata]|uniref:Serine carboxypeptidase-like 7 n=1 Tax=Brassica carinata TaxID=52824 RepID=A0A8X7PKS2_BRACI|nr:hypothetical protein Bca52824_083121 [Brassica carinata]
MAKDYVSSVLKSLLLLLQLVLLIHDADSASTVKFLPGFDGPLPFELETGYIGVGEEEEVQLFYYFIKSERNPEEDPLLLWLSGGPGCSSISGLLFENGPLTMKLDAYNGSLPSLVSTTYSWTKLSNIIFLDQPVGTGFSYSRTSLHNKPSDSGEARRIHEFLQKWLGKHQEFTSNPFYAAGDSYSGMIIPALVQEISKGNYQCCNPPINLQGYMLGNPITEHNGVNYRIPYAHGMALISDELYESLKRVCKGEYAYVDSRNTECLKLLEEYNKCTDRITLFIIQHPLCETETPNCYIYRYLLSTYWANDKTVRKALQINEESIGEWIRCNLDIPYNHDIVSSVPYHKNNSISGYRSLIFSGDHDMAVPYLGTQAWIRSLNYSIIDDWRPWMIDDQIAGEVGIHQSINQRKALSCFKGGSMANLCKQLAHIPSHHADSASIVEFLPGFEGPLPFELETGYIGVGEEEEMQLFYYFIKSERNPEEDPLLLWLSGGPGCSSISGLLFENAGPLTIKLEEYNGTLPSLVSTTYSWKKVINFIRPSQYTLTYHFPQTTSIIFLDQPVGTGFSYSRTQLVDKPSDSGSMSFFKSFRPTKQCYVLGNPLTEFETDMNSRIPFAHGMALISDELYEVKKHEVCICFLFQQCSSISFFIFFLQSLKIICKGKYVNVDPSNTECLKLVEEYNKVSGYLLATYWANEESVRKALQINKVMFPQTSSIIYLDQPVGTGFSFSTQHVDTPSDSGEARRIHEFLQKWLVKHEEFIPNPFYVGGHSYTGKIVPPLVQEISKGNVCSVILFLLQSLKRICKGKYVNVDSGNIECLKLLEEYNKFTKTVNPFLISEPSCETETPDCYIYRHLLATYWANDESVRKALQINKESIGRWVRCNFDIPYTHDIINSVPYHVDNSINGYRSLIFRSEFNFFFPTKFQNFMWFCLNSGDHDLGVPYLGTQAWIRSLNYSVIDDWRPWMITHKLAGYTRTYANKMTFATIKASGGGHTAEFKPEESSVMFQRWISGQPL